MINTAILFIEDNFGTKLIKNDLDNTEKMPIYLSKGYSYKLITLFNEQFLLMHSESNNTEMISMIQHKLRVKNTLNIDYPIILVFDNLNTYQRKKLINEKISFVVPGRMIFIFEIGTVFRTRQQSNYFNNVTNNDLVHMSPATQGLFLYLMTTNDFNSSMEKIAKKLNITKMSVSRGYNELYKLGLIEKKPYNNSIRYYFKKKTIDIWEEAKEYLDNPVYKTFKMYRKTIERKSDLFTISGESALSKYTMISEPSTPVYGITKKKFKHLSLEEDELYIYDQNPVILQIFDYCLPTIKNVLHPLSIYLLFKHDSDPRIRHEVNNMIDNYFRNKEV